MRFLVLLIDVSKNTQVLILKTVEINPCRSPLSADAASLSPLILSFSVSLFLLFAVFPGMFYLSPFGIKTLLTWYLVIIDCNKLI
jgi:hypothetical protein